MNDMDRAGDTFKLIESGHIDIDYYMNKAHLSRSQAATKMACYARDKFIEAVRSAVRVFASKLCRQSRKDGADQMKSDGARL